MTPPRKTTSRTTTARKPATTRRSARKPSSRARSVTSTGLPELGPGERYTVVDLPWGMQFPGVKYSRKYKVSVHCGAVVPPAIQQYASRDYSYERWVEDHLNATPKNISVGKTKKMTPREHQKEAAHKINTTFATGQRSFLVADSTGTGKTLSTLYGVCFCAHTAKYGGEKPRAKVLIVCPKNVIPEWRQTLHAFPAAKKLIQPLVINYEQLTKLIAPPAEAARAKKAKTKKHLTAKRGKPLVDWDFVIFDEAHLLKNYPDTMTSQSACTVAQLNKKYTLANNVPFTVFVTATPGSSPLNLSCMSSVIAPFLAPQGKDVTPEKWAEFLMTQGFSIKKSQKGTYSWVTNKPWGTGSDNPTERARAERKAKEAEELRRADAIRIGKALKTPGSPFIKRSPVDLSGWPEQQVIPVPLELNGEQEALYVAAWTRFRQWLMKPGAYNDPKTALVETLRYRQKSSLLKVEPMVERVVNFVETGNQVYISCQFLETIDDYVAALSKRGITCVEVTGRVEDKEHNRVLFQKGQAQVILSNIVAGVSFHAGQQLADGTTATTAPRVTLMHDIRQNPNDSVQALGRAHRSGQNSLTYIPYIEDTVDETVVQSFVEKFTNMNLMTGEETSKADFMKDIFFTSVGITS